MRIGIVGFIAAVAITVVLTAVSLAVYNTVKETIIRKRWERSRRYGWE